MKRLFSVIISLFTVTIPKKLGYEKIKKAAPPQEPAPRSEPLLDYKAKGFGGIENVEKWLPEPRTAEYFKAKYARQNKQDAKFWKYLKRKHQWLTFLKRWYRPLLRLPNPLYSLESWLLNHLGFPVACLVGVLLGNLFGWGLWIVTCQLFGWQIV